MGPSDLITEGVDCQQQVSCREHFLPLPLASWKDYRMFPCWIAIAQSIRPKVNIDT